ncbi:PE-PPE, C-terminal [Mycobacteriaceae bacterium]
MARIYRFSLSTAIVSVLLATALTAAPAAQSDTLLFADGAKGTLGRLLPDDLFGEAESFLGGAYKDDTLSVLDYPASLWPVTGLLDPTLGASIRIGTANLAALARSTSGPIFVSGVSEGSIVVQQTQEVLNADPMIPSDTTFIMIANPNLGIARGLYGIHIPILNYTPRPLPETRFNTVVVINQYDGFADPILRPWNLLTVVNAVMAVVYVHPFAQNSDLSTVPLENITITTNSQGGTTTTYFVPTPQLPLTMPLRHLRVPDRIVDTIDDALRPIIDAGYKPIPSNAESAFGAVFANNVLNPAATTRVASRPSAAAGQRMWAAQSAKSAASTRRARAVDRATGAVRLPGSSSLPAATGTSVPR